ncbi:adhesion G-protein coupled receptor G4 [Microcaecilia unicolor]|uniref:Adhesion G-protein coupled receptor G4 n=1 Tax=Microcaecilia unicolor TaxID=1415580 RepID=A0A6P7YRA8_9AMPH|nr:adhesion G-protein coupled receptor G4 [Microcaecilia unicolor]
MQTLENICYRFSITKMRTYFELDKWPIELICMMILFTSFNFSDTASLRGKKVQYYGSSIKSVSLTNKSVPNLLKFTVCIDLQSTINSRDWTVFTYVSAKGKQDLGLVGSEKNLRLYHCDTVHEIEIELTRGSWHTVCCLYNGENQQLELYVNSTSVLNTSTSSSFHLEENGSLVLGYNHTKNGSSIELMTSTNFVGCLYFFQMWDYVRPPSDNCSEGNIINWKDEVWKFTDMQPTPDTCLRCAKPSGTTSTVTPSLILRTTSASAAVTPSTVTPPSTPSTAAPTSRATEPAPSTAVLTYPGETTRTHSSPANLSSPSVSSVPLTTVYTSTFDASATPPHVTFYIIRIIITVLDVNQDDSVTENLSRLTEAWLNNNFMNTEFVVVHFLTSEESSNRKRRWSSAQLRAYVQSEIKTYSNVNIRWKVLVQANSSETEDILITKIEDLLNRTSYRVDPSSVALQSINVTHLDPGFCPANKTCSKEDCNWPDTNATETASLVCNDKPSRLATRYCNISIINDRSVWESPNMEKCKVYLPDYILGLKDVNVTSEDAEDIAKHILNLILNANTLEIEEIEVILSKTSEIVNIGDMNISLAQSTLEILNALLTKILKLTKFTNEILKLVEEVGQKVHFPGGKANLTSQKLVLALMDLTQAEFEEMYFCVTSYHKDKNPEIFHEKSPCGQAVAFVFLPGSLRPHVNKSSRIQFNFVGSTSLFKHEESRNKILNTYVAGARIGNSKIVNLKDPVNITLKHKIENKDRSTTECVFWDFEMNENLGGWNSSGCKVAYTDVNYTTCQCDHLTHFGVLMDISGTKIDAVNEYILTIITYVGCGTSSIFLGVALVIYIAFDQLRRDYPSKILMNLCMALLMLNLVFLLDTWLSSLKNYALCLSVAVLLHYFLLASFTWMGLEAVHMYFALVKVFNVYIPKYMLKFCFVGWGVPAIIVVIVVSIKRDFYGTTSNLSSEIPFCWIRENIVFYISVVGYFCIIFLTNMAMFIVVLLQINSVKSKKEKNQKDGFLHGLKSSASLTFLLGLTWGFAFFAWGPVKIVFFYLFSIFNTLQGFSIFVFHCLLKENVRKQCQIHLCCGRFSLFNYSEWNRMSTVGESGQKYSTHKISSETSLSTKSLQSNNTCSTFNGSKSQNDESYTNPCWMLPMKQTLVLPDIRRMAPTATKIHKL